MNDLRPHWALSDAEHAKAAAPSHLPGTQFSEGNAGTGCGRPEKEGGPEPEGRGEQVFTVCSGYSGTRGAWCLPANVSVWGQGRAQSLNHEWRSLGSSLGQCTGFCPLRPMTVPGSCRVSSKGGCSFRCSFWRVRSGRGSGEQAPEAGHTASWRLVCVGARQGAWTQAVATEESLRR